MCYILKIINRNEFANNALDLSRVADQSKHKNATFISYIIRNISRFNIREIPVSPPPKTTLIEFILYIFFLEIGNLKSAFNILKIKEVKAK